MRNVQHHHTFEIGALPRFCFKLLALASLLLAFASPAHASSEQQDLVNKAQATIEQFVASPDMTWFREHLSEAKAVMIVPVLVKGGFIFGGSGGHGLLLVHDEGSDSWSYPAFNFMSSVTFGLQIGGEASQVVLLVMSDKGVNAMLSTEFKLGADVSVAAGPVGGGTSTHTADVVAFSRDKGLFGGFTIEGAVIKPRSEWDQAYYGAPVTTVDIVVRREVTNAGAEELRAALGGEQVSSASTYDIATIQRALANAGYDPGPVDGLMGPKTKGAIEAYQTAVGLEPTGQPSADLQEKLLSSQ
jgi:lipid-binding SYLF domain-containing protein